MKITKKQLRQLILESLSSLEKQRIKSKAADEFDDNITSGMELSSASQIYDYQRAGFDNYKDFYEEKNKKEYEDFHKIKEKELERKTREELSAEFPDMDWSETRPGNTMRMERMYKEFLKMAKEDPSNTFRLMMHYNKMKDADTTRKDPRVQEIKKVLQRIYGPSFG